MDALCWRWPGQAPEGGRPAVLGRRALETGRTSWTASIDAIRLEPGTDLAAVTAGQVREVLERLIGSGPPRHVQAGPGAVDLPAAGRAPTQARR